MEQGFYVQRKEFNGVLWWTLCFVGLSQMRIYFVGNSSTCMLYEPMRVTHWILRQPYPSHKPFVSHVFRPRDNWHGPEWFSFCQFDSVDLPELVQVLGQHDISLDLTDTTDLIPITNTTVPNTALFSAAFCRCRQVWLVPLGAEVMSGDSGSYPVGVVTCPPLPGVENAPSISLPPVPLK